MAPRLKMKNYLFLLMFTPFLARGETLELTETDCNDTLVDRLYMDIPVNKTSAEMIRTLNGKKTFFTVSRIDPKNEMNIFSLKLRVTSVKKHAEYEFDTKLILKKYVPAIIGSFCTQQNDIKAGYKYSVTLQDSSL
jgi:hypothetical protein